MSCLVLSTVLETQQGLASGQRGFLIRGCVVEKHTKVRRDLCSCLGCFVEVWLPGSAVFQAFAQ